MIPPFLSVFILVVFFASIALADDFKTIYGKEYKNAEVSRVEPDGILLRTKSGISKIYFNELPKEVQERYHYDPQQATRFTSQTIQTIEGNNRAREQKAEEDKRRAQEIAKKNEILQRQQEAEMQRQQRQADQQQQQREPQQQRQIQTGANRIYSRSQEGIPEHTYEILLDHTIKFGGVNIRLRRGEQYHGRILVDHAEIDRDGRSYTVPSSILSPPKD